MAKARHSRESRMRSVREGNLPPIFCATCGQSFWDEMQKRDHYGWSAGRPYCQYAPAGTPPDDRPDAYSWMED